MTIGKIAFGLAMWELGWWMRRNAVRKQTLQDAIIAANALGRPLVMVGAPDLGLTSGPDPGDCIVIDIEPSSHPNAMQADICEPLPFPDDSVVVYCCYTLECVSDYHAALAELQRISGGHFYMARTEPWTLTSVLYPGIKQAIPHTPAAPLPEGA